MYATAGELVKEWSKMHLIFEDQTFSFELLRTLSYAPYGGADIGECLAAAYHIQKGDFESWLEE